MMGRQLFIFFAVLAVAPTVVGAQIPPAAAPAAAAIPAANWPSSGRDLGLTRFSPLTEITPANVNRLTVKWTFGTGSLRGHEGNPLVIDGRLYLHTPHPTTVYAFDLDRPGDPPLWRYAPSPGRGPTLAACCDVSNRGLAWHPSGKLYVPLFQGDLAAIDLATGKEIWKVRNGDPGTGLTMQAAPLVVGDVVIVGTGGGEFGARGHLTAYNALTGARLWRGYSTGSDTEVLLKLYSREGESILPLLRGMFAFAIWDRKERSVFLARDPYGIKPLYLAHSKAGWLFASQVKALLASGLVSRD
ncbi:MAG: hypothetical protein E4G90_01790, partial [Gemmatimonadales bacterium]